MTRRERITIEPGKCGGKPCIRRMRIRVCDVLGLLANGLTPLEIIKQLPDLELEDVYASLEYAAELTEKRETSLIPQDVRRTT